MNDDAKGPAEKDRHTAQIKANDAFVLAMANAVNSGREKVKVGTYVDSTEPMYHKRIYGTAPRSSCGSPAAMCMDSAVAQSGAEAMK